MQRAILWSVFVCLPCGLFAADWPQFLGPQRNGISEETGLLETWPADGPREVWRKPGGVGMSGLAIQQGRLITLVQREGRQFLAAYSARTGEPLWATDVAPAYKNAMGDGPRGTPTIAGQEVFAFTGEGILAAVAADDGKLLWSQDVRKQLQGEIAEYGMACSPLVLKKTVVVTLGAPDGAVAAFDRETGKPVWKTGNDPAGYSSPALLNVGGQEQVVAFTGGAALGVSPDEGEVLWRYPFTTDFSCNIAAPLAYRNQVFLSAGENHGSTLLALKPKGAGFEAAEVWSSLGPKSVLRNEWQTSILVGDHLYGFDNVGGAGPISHLACIHAATGKSVWQKLRFGKGNMIWADGKLFMTSILGELIVAKVSPAGYEELGRREVVGKTRQAPALVSGKLYVRDDRDLVCFDVSKP